MLPEEEVEAVLQNGTSGVLSVFDEEGYPYGVPLSYVYTDGKFYFHSATAGHKLRAIMQHEKASFTVIDKDDVKPQEFTTYFRSVIAFGKIRRIEDEAEKLRTLRILSDRYAPNTVPAREAEIKQYFNALCMLEFQVEKMTGKEGMELARARRNGKD